MRTRTVIEMRHVPWRRARTEPVSLPQVARTSTAPDPAVPSPRSGAMTLNGQRGEARCNKC